jgi:hypothetical protein
MSKRGFTAPELARHYGVSVKKVLAWINTGELAALNLASPGCTRPRYHVTAEALEQFEAARRVTPDTGESTAQRVRRRPATAIKEFV